MSALFFVGETVTFRPEVAQMAHDELFGDDLDINESEALAGGTFADSEFVVDLVEMEEDEYFFQLRLKNSDGERGISPVYFHEQMFAQGDEVKDLSEISTLIIN